MVFQGSGLRDLRRQHRPGGPWLRRGFPADPGRVSTGSPRRSATARPPGMVFKARQPTGKLSAEWPTPEDNLITSRILWLEGLEPGHNQGTRCGRQGRRYASRRFVYIHGTNQTDKLGQPNSHGCVLLSDQDDRSCLDRKCLFRHSGTDPRLTGWLGRRRLRRCPPRSRASASPPDPPSCRPRYWCRAGLRRARRRRRPGCPRERSRSSKRGGLFRPS